MKVAIANIKIPKKYPRRVDPVTVNNLAKDIRENGLKCPIVINQNNRLIDGLHRICACKELNMTEIACIYIESC